MQNYQELIDAKQAEVYALKELKQTGRLTEAGKDAEAEYWGALIDLQTLRDQQKYQHYLRISKIQKGQKLEGLGFDTLEVAEFVNNAESWQLLLTDAFESGDVDYILLALGIVSRARNISNLAKEAGLSSSTLYNFLDGKGSPSAKTIFALLNALNITLKPVIFV